MYVTVRYSVPVFAVVDTRSRRVVRVVEDDECIALDSNGLGHDVDDYREAGTVEKCDESGAQLPEAEITSLRLVRQAITVAESVEWPAWERGW